MSPSQAEDVAGASTMVEVLPNTVMSPREEPYKYGRSDSGDERLPPGQLHMASPVERKMVPPSSSPGAPTYTAAEEQEQRPTCSFSMLHCSLYQKMAEGPDKMAYRGLWFVVDELRGMCSRKDEEELPDASKQVG
eukprot:TRINITY_DN123410_c0_g1_i1.p1 TRINITY_DN123410_c0_g1~~TRINITY_DN123410_c0_g1_i1.p1  ORF type:complete len:135 (-),score=9.80 TRINITY_DN123410_c0_g1_i1:434-838(-)